MASNNDIQSEMSTKITVDAQQAGNEVENLTRKFKDLTASWKAEEAVAKANGDSVAASKARYEGLSETLEVQKQRVAALKREREALQSSMKSGGTVTKEETDDLKNLDRQLASAAAKVTSLSNQQQRAKNSFDYAKSGLRDLKNEYYNNNRAIDSNVEKLKAEGQTAEAQKARLSGLRISLVNLNKQQEAAKRLADEAAKSEGSNSNLYKRRITDYNKISAAIAKTRAESEELNKAMNPPETSKWTVFREKILGVSSVEERATAMGEKMKGVFSGAFLGSLTGNILPMVQTQLQGVFTNGMKAAQAGLAIQGRWKNIGASASGIKELTAQVTELRTHSNLAVQTINSLQTRFYGMTKSVNRTKALTQGVASLADSMKLSEQQANGFANGLSRIESSGKVTSASLGRLEKQAPGLATQLAKAAGISQKQFNALVSSGKMTTQQFNGYLEQASKSYDKNAKAFTSSATGSAHSLQQQWAITQATLAKPLVKVEATGLNQLNQALSNKDTQRGLQVLATGMATLAVNAAKALAILARHQTVIKGVAAAVLGLVGAYKGMRIVVSVSETIAAFTNVVKDSSIAMKTFGIATRLMTGPLGIAITAVTGLVTAFTLLYRHNAKFRSFVNGVGRNIKAMGRSFQNGWRGILRGATNFHNRLSKGWNNYWKQHNRQQQQNQRLQERQELASQRRRQRALANFNRTVSRDARGAWKDLENAAKNGSSRVGNWYDRMRDNTSRTVQNMAREHPRIFGDMYKTVEDRTKVWHDLVNGHWNRLGSDTANYTSDMRKTNHDIFADMYDKLNSLTGGRLGDMKNAWDKALNAIHDSVVNIGGHIHQAFDNLMNGLIDVFKGLINGIVDGINWVVDHVGGSGHLSKFSIGHFANGTNGPIMKKQLAILNDAPDNEYRELVHKKATGKTFLMPAKRNILMPLEPGDEVLDGKRTNQLMKSLGVTAHYANGAIGGFFSNVFDTAKDAADDAMDWVDKALKNVIEFGKELFEHFTNAVKPKSNDSLNSALKINLPGYFGRALQSWLKKQLDQMNTDNPSGTGVERWRPVIMRAFAALHVAPASWKVEKLLRQIQTESGGDPNAWQQVHDVNSGGNEARGLLQFAGSTLAADALPGHTDWHKGYNEILAAIHVLENGGEGGWGNVGNGHGWASGGLITQHGMYEVGEYNRPEMIIPLDISKRGRAYTLLAQVMSQFKSEDASNNTVDTEDSQVKSLNQKFDALLAQNQQLISLIDKLIGVTDSATNPAARYKRTQRDINMARAQSFI